MGEFVGAFATSHSPGITGFPERADADQRHRVDAAFAEVRRRITDSGAQALICVSVEHFTNFFLGNLPAFAVGTAADYLGPVTPEMGEFLRVPQHRYPGHAGLGEHVYRHALGAHFDPALVGGDHTFDENFCVPLKHLDPDNRLPLVPVIVNAVNPRGSLPSCSATLVRSVSLGSTRPSISSLTSVPLGDVVPQVLVPGRVCRTGFPLLLLATSGHVPVRELYHVRRLPRHHVPQSAPGLCLDLVGIGELGLAVLEMSQLGLELVLLPELLGYLGALREVGAQGHGDGQPERAHDDREDRGTPSARPGEAGSAAVAPPSHPRAQSSVTWRGKARSPA